MNSLRAKRRVPAVRVLALVLTCAVLTPGCRRRSMYELPPPPPFDGVRFVGRAEVLAPGDSVLEVRVHAINTARVTRTLQWGEGAMNVRVSGVGLTRPHSWDYAAWARSWRFESLLVVMTRDIAPGDSVDRGYFTHRIPIRVILGDSLAPGRYLVTALVGANGRSFGNIQSGEVQLGPIAR